MKTTNRPQPSCTSVDVVAHGMHVCDFAEDLVRCLSESPHQIAPKYFYDAAGSRLFERICTLPEYYLTRTELTIFRTQAARMAARIGPSADVIEFGAGSLQKIRLLLDALHQPQRLVAVDISGEHLGHSVDALRRDYPELPVAAIVGDFTHPQRLPLPAPPTAGARRVGFFPGSTIGNFSPEDARRFLSAAARLLRGGGLLIGVDLIKEPATLHAAYNDAEGVTAAFNRNLLHHANRVAGADFIPDAFAHYAFYNPVRQCIEMHLVSRAAQTVTIAGRRFDLAAGESIHTEDSFKYTIDGFRSLARSAGFVPDAVWTDPDQLFSVHWLSAPRTAAVT